MVFNGEDQLSFEFYGWFFHFNICINILISWGMLFLLITKTCCANNIESRLYDTFQTYVRNTGWLSVPTRLLYNKVIHTYKALNNLKLTYISNLLTPLSEKHSRSLRSSENGLKCIPRSRSAYTIALSPTASKLWNSLPQDIRTKCSLNAFKTCERDYIWIHCIRAISYPFSRHNRILSVVIHVDVDV